MGFDPFCLVFEGNHQETVAIVEDRFLFDKEPVSGVNKVNQSEREMGMRKKPVFTSIS